MNKSSFFIVGQHAVIEALKNSNRKIEAINNLKEATLVGENPFRPTLIAKNAEPHIADRIKSKKKLLTGNNLFKNYILFFGCGI